MNVSFANAVSPRSRPPHHKRKNPILVDHFVPLPVPPAPLNADLNLSQRKCIQIVSDEDGYSSPSLPKHPKRPHPARKIEKIAEVITCPTTPEILDALACKEGTVYLEGGTYVGELFELMPHGKGTWSHPNGETYAGEWRYGQKYMVGL